MSVSAPILHRLASTRGMRWVMIRAQRPLDELLRGSRFMPSTIGGIETPICFLTTTGRRSGEPRTVPLVYLGVDDDSFAVVASNYGQADHPAWSLNLEAAPSATMAIEEAVTPVVARRAEPHEAAELWPRFESVWPGYATYRSLTDRSIRMYLLTAVAEET